MYEYARRISKENGATLKRVIDSYRDWVEHVEGALRNDDANFVLLELTLRWKERYFNEVNLRFFRAAYERDPEEWRQVTLDAEDELTYGPADRLPKVNLWQVAYKHNIIENEGFIKQLLHCDFVVLYSDVQGYFFGLEDYDQLGVNGYPVSFIEAYWIPLFEAVYKLT